MKLKRRISWQITVTLVDFINIQLVAKKDVGLIKDQSGHTLHDDNDKAKCFNRFFRLYLLVIMELYQILTRRQLQIVLLILLLHYKDVVKSLKALKPKSSAGPDGLPSALLKKLAPSIAFPLMLIFSAILSMCTNSHCLENCNSLHRCLKKA